MEKFDWGSFAAGLLAGAAGATAAVLLTKKTEVLAGGPVIITDGSADLSVLAPDGHLHIRDSQNDVDWGPLPVSVKGLSHVAHITVTKDHKANSFDNPGTCIISYIETVQGANRDGTLRFDSLGPAGATVFVATSVPHLLSDFGTAGPDHILRNSTITSVNVDGKPIDGPNISKIEIRF